VTSLAQEPFDCPACGARGTRTAFASTNELQSRDLDPGNPVGRDAMARAIRADAGRRLQVHEARTLGGKPHFAFRRRESSAGPPHE
jgi:hypothetical protein